MKVFTVSDKIRFIEKAFGPGRMSANGDNFDVYCPICESPDKAKKKLAIRVDDDANHCWTCGYRARSLYAMLMKYCSRTLAVEYADTFLSTDEFDRNKKFLSLSDNDSNVQQQITLPEDFKLLVDNVTVDENNSLFHTEARNYVVDRGSNNQDLWYFKLGVSCSYKWWKRIIMPSFDKFGNLNYLVGRAFDSSTRRKYDSPMVDKTSFIFNEINVDFKQPLVLCEGPFDLIKCVQNTVPLLGSEINEQSLLFEKIILNKTKIYLALDSDMMYTKVPRIIRKLQNYNIDVKIIDVASFGKSDPGEMSKNEFVDAYSVACSATWETLTSLKLNHVSKTTLSIGNTY